MPWSEHTPTADPGADGADHAALITQRLITPRLITPRSGLRPSLPAYTPCLGIWEEGMHGANRGAAKSWSPRLQETRCSKLILNHFIKLCAFNKS